MSDPRRENLAEPSNDGSSLQDLLTTLFAMQSTNGAAGSEGDGERGNGHTISLSGIDLQTLAALMQGGSGSANALMARVMEEAEEEEEEEEDGEDDNYGGHYYSAPSVGQWISPHTEPQRAGLELLASGDFGRVGSKRGVRRKDGNMFNLLRRQRAFPAHSVSREDTHSKLVPNTNGTAVATYPSNMYTASFSNDSSFYYTCSQDFRLHIFDMRAPPSAKSQRHQGLVTRMPIRKIIHGSPGRWTVTDANLSPDNERIIYSSISSTVYMASTAVDGGSQQIPIEFGDPLNRMSVYHRYMENFGIWSCRFSADGNEIVAGGNGKIFVYDLLANRRTVKINAHEDDVNSCCWADTASGNVLVSASDDTFLKVWDRRSMGATSKPSGVLIGHTEGITYVSAKGDGRYVISNGKDQALRLWDLRKMRTSAEHQAVENHHYGIRNYDYRNYNYPKPRHAAHPKDCSVMTYRGHSVLRTLIRCHFSPAETTGAQYIYSGSADGKIHIWSLDGRVVHVLDRSKTLPASFDPSGPEPSPASSSRERLCVRDVSWNTQEPVIMSAGWQDGTVIARHEFKDLLKTSGALEDWVERERSDAQESGLRRSIRLQEQDARTRGTLHVPGAFLTGDGSDDIEDDEDD